MSTETANRHAEISRRMILQANYELDYLGDRVQASEKASGAVAHAIKAIGEDRQWRHGSHNLRREIVNLIADEFQRPDLKYLQRAADDLHANFYEDRLFDFRLRELLTEVTDLLDFLLEIREQGPNPGFVPTPDQQRSMDRLRLSEDDAAADPMIDFPPPMPPFAPPEG